MRSDKLVKRFTRIIKHINPLLTCTSYYPRYKNITKLLQKVSESGKLNSAANFLNTSLNTFQNNYNRSTTGKSSLELLEPLSDNINEVIEQVSQSLEVDEHFEKR